MRKHYHKMYCFCCIKVDKQRKTYFKKLRKKIDYEREFEEMKKETSTKA